jgi:hypothetical protein
MLRSLWRPGADDFYALLLPQGEYGLLSAPEFGEAWGDFAVRACGH